MTPYVYAGLTPFRQDQYRTKLLKLSPKQVLEQAAIFFDLDAEFIKCSSRKLEIREIRQVTIYAIRKACPLATLKEIGRLFNRHHSTIIHSIDIVDYEVDKLTKLGKKAVSFLNSLS